MAIPTYIDDTDVESAIPAFIKMKSSIGEKEMSIGDTFGKDFIFYILNMNCKTITWEIIDEHKATLEDWYGDDYPNIGNLQKF